MQNAAKVFCLYIALWLCMAMHPIVSPPHLLPTSFSLSLSFIRPLSFEAAGIVNKTVVAGAILI
jgi:hypothetical protein